MTIATRLEKKDVPALIRILTNEPKFILILSSFGADLLENRRIPNKIKDFQLNRKVNYILNEYCDEFVEQASYEKIATILLQNYVLLDLSKSVLLVAKQKRGSVEGSDGTRIEEKDIANIRKILTKNENLMGRLHEFEIFLEVQNTAGGPNPTPKAQLSRILYAFQRMYTNNATYEALITILRCQMGLRALADELERTFCIDNKQTIQKYKIKTIIREENPENQSVLKSSVADLHIGVKSLQLSAFPQSSTEDDSSFSSDSDLETTGQPNKSNNPVGKIDDCKIKSQCNCGRAVSVMEVQNDEIGLSYESIFGKYLSSDVAQVALEDPYLLEAHQKQNLHKFLDLILKCCPSLKTFSVQTSKRSEFQQKQSDKEFARQFIEFREKCENRNVEFELILDQNLHDRCVAIGYCSNVLISLGRGLDIFNKDGKCKKTRIIIVGQPDQSVRKLDTKMAQPQLERNFEDLASTSNTITKKPVPSNSGISVKRSGSKLKISKQTRSFKKCIPKTKKTTP